MIVLACETSTLLGSVAVCENGKILSFAESFRQGSHSEALNTFIEKALHDAGKKLSDIDLFVSGIGPGSFTGIRISLNSIKTLAYCFNKPVLGLNSLHSLAVQAADVNKSTEFEFFPIISMINAYKNMVYVATHKLENSQLIEIKKPEVVRVQNLDSYITEKSIVCGDAYGVYEKYFTEHLSEKIVRHSPIPDEPHAKTLAQIAFNQQVFQQNWNELIPLYLRASEAEENLQGIKYQPLI